MDFYIEEAGLLYVADEDEQWLKANHVHRADYEKLQLGKLGRLFFHPARTDAERESAVDQVVTAPLPENDSVIIAGSVLDHEDRLIRGRRVSDVVASAIRSSVDEMYLLSTIPEIKGCFLVGEFDYEIFYRVTTGNLTTPLCIVSANFDWCVFWDFDLEYTIVTRVPGCTSLPGVFELAPLFFEDFEANYYGSVPAGQRHRHLLERYVLPYVSRAGVCSAPGEPFL